MFVSATCFLLSINQVISEFKITLPQSVVITEYLNYNYDGQCMYKSITGMNNTIIY